MNPTIEQLLRVQDVDSQMIFLKESLRTRPLELDDDKKKVQAARSGLDAILAEIKKTKMAADQRELDVKKCDTEIEKLNVALNQAKSNQEYTIYKEQIKKQEEARDKASEEVLEKLTSIDGLEAKRKDLQGRLDAAEKTLKKKDAEVQELCKAMQSQINDLSGKRSGLVAGIDGEKLKIYERVLLRHNNYGLARVENQICQGCFMTVTHQQINLLMQGQFLQCNACQRVLYL